jgi:hypothetical protein
LHKNGSAAALVDTHATHVSPEVARDSLHHTNKFTVEKGIISPVHDSYGKKVSI